MTVQLTRRDLLTRASGFLAVANGTVAGVAAGEFERSLYQGLQRA
ncbi:hypothetical protein [Paraburkholderia phytofirmans]|nr:hypothetical protein [Paraburkholderia phytofirmans]